MTPDPADQTALELTALLDRIAQGDQAALRALYDRTAPKLYALTLRVLSNKEWAEDVLQDTYLNIWKIAGDYRASLAAPVTWMAMIARSRALDFLRRRKAERLDTNVEFDDVLAETLADEDDDPSEQALMGQQARALDACLRRLEAKQRQVVTLAYLRDLSHHELAEQLRLPLGTVKTWIRRGLERLRQCMESKESVGVM